MDSHLAEEGQPGSPNGLPGTELGWPGSVGGFMLQAFDWKRVDPAWPPQGQEVYSPYANFMVGVCRWTPKA